MDVTTVSAVSEDEGTVVHLKDVAGELLYDGDGDQQTPVTIRIAGTYSDRYRKAERKISHRNTKRRRRDQELDDETLDKNTKELVAACIIEWSFTMNGQPYPITPENWKTLASLQPQWEEQVTTAMYDHERFFVRPSTS